MRVNSRVARAVSIAIGMGALLTVPGDAAGAASDGLPFAFVRNAGQSGSGVAFEARGARASFAFSPRGAMLVFSGSRDVALRMRFVGARAVRPRAHRPSRVRFSYLRGSDPRRWQRGMHGYRELSYRRLWPGVDLRFRGDRRTLKYEVHVAPGADPSRVRLAYAGARSLTRDHSGDLLVRTAAGTLRDARPVAYQRIRGRRVPVRSRFRLLGGTRFGFAVGRYDHRRPLVIDPGIAYSTLLGGSQYDEATGVAVDGQGNAYVTGTAQSTDFPTAPGSYDATRGSPGDVFVVKLSPSGAGLSYATFLGGGGYDEGNAVAVDANGSAYVTGQTGSADFPTTAGAFDTSYNTNNDAFVTKLTPAGDGLMYSTFLSGTSSDTGSGIAVDASGSAYVVGTANSADFPVQGPLDPTYNDGGDAFVTQLNPAGSALAYSTYLGGKYGDGATGVAVRDGAAYVAGSTFSTHAFGALPGQEFPVTPSELDELGYGQTDAFAAKVAAGGAALSYSVLLGGSFTDLGMGIAVDPAGSAYVVGTATPGFPTTMGAYDPSVEGNTDAFVTHLDPTGTARTYSTVLGGVGDDTARGVALDASGRAVVTGITDYADFPTTGDRLQGWGGGQDAFLTTLTSDGTGLAFSTYLGSGATDVGRAVATDTTGAYVAGGTDGAFPTTAGAVQTDNKGARDAFVTKVGLPLVDPPPGGGGGGSDGGGGGAGGGGGDGGGGAGGGAGGGGDGFAARFTGPGTTTGLGLTSFDASGSTGAVRYRWDVNGDGRDDIGCGGDQPLLTARLAGLVSGVQRAGVGALTVRLTAVRADGATATTSQAVQVSTSATAPRLAGSVAQPLACRSGRTSSVLGSTCFDSTVEFGVVSARGCLARVTKAADVPAGERAIIDKAIAYFNADERRKTMVWTSCTEVFHRNCTTRSNEIERSVVDPLLEATDLRIARSTVKVNGVEFIPQGGATIAVFPQIGRIISSNAIVKFGDATVPIDRQVNLDVEGKVLNGNIVGTGQRMTIMSFKPSVPILDFAGFGIDGEVKLDLVSEGLRHYSEASFRLALPNEFGVFGGQPPSGAVKLQADNDTPPELDEADVRVPYAELGGLKLSDVRFHYKLRGGDGCDRKLWKATANVYLGIEDGSAGFRLAPDPPQNGVAFCAGSFKSAGGEFVFGNPIPPPQLFPGVFLKSINFATQLDPTLIRGGAKITAGDITEADGSVLAVFATPQRPYTLSQGDAVGGLAPLGALNGRRLQSTTFAVGGTFGFSLPAVGRVDFGNAYWLYSYADYVAFGGKVLIPVPGIVLNAGIDGELSLSSGLFTTHGEATACVAGGISSLGCVGGEAWVTSKGFVVCGSIAGELHPGVGYRWGDTLPEVWLFDGCKPSGYWLDTAITPARARAAAEGPRSFAVKAGQEHLRVRLTGAGGAPDVTLRSPDGEQVATSANAFTSTAHLATFRHVATGVTWLEVAGGAPGTYTVTPNEGSPAIAKLATSVPATLPKITAAVRGRGATRTLAYRIGTLQRGQRVTFVERAGTTMRRIGSVTDGSGTLRFRPAATGDGARRVTALVEVAGLRLAEPVVARYRVVVRRPGKPGAVRVRVRRRGKAVTVTWAAAAGAARYGVVVSPVRGAQRILRVPARRRSIRITGAAAGAGGSLRISALDARGNAGPVRRSRWRGTTKRPSRFKPFAELQRAPVAKRRR